VDAGETEIETSVAGVTVSATEPITPELEAAETVAVPAVLLVATPVELTLTTEGLEELQVTELVRFVVVPSV
jgi:hypothetical protein